MKRRRGLSLLPSVKALVAITLLLSAFIPAVMQSSIRPAFADAPAGFSDRLVAGGLNLPASMEFAPDGRLFVAEKDGSIRVIKDGVLLDEPFTSLSVNSEGERGLQGMAFDPEFSSNGYLYVYYTTETDPIHNRVSRITADPANPDRALAGSEQPILDLEPLATASHNGGGLEFGPDGMLYISTGDNYFPYLSESLTSRFGKILRINPDGSIPTDNPFYNVQGAYREIWALGLRNPFSFAFSSSGETMFINDVGQDTWEEINLGSSGANYGWPTCEGECASDGDSESQFTDPIYSYQHSADEGGGASITGGTFYEASQFPSEYHGSYFFGDYTSGFIKRLTPDTNQAVDFLTNIDSPVDVEVDPDNGYLYYLSIVSGEVREVRFTTQGNYDPTAIADANQTQGLAPLAVDFDGSQSTDPNSEDTLTYSWDFGDDSAPITGEASVTHTYNSSGLYSATLTVNDGNGGSNTDTVEITIGNPPVATIDAPAEGTTYDAGDTISFSGSATDEGEGEEGAAEEESLPPSAFDWKIDFHHNTHTHPFQEYNEVTEGSFTIPTVGETDDNVWYRIYLTVTDSDGLTHTTTRDIVPNTSTVTITSNVTGLQLMLDGQPRTSPHSFTGVAGTERTLEAPTMQVLDNAVYNFDSWSDSGEQSHTFITPQDDETITAFYSEGSSAAAQQTLTIRSESLEGSELTGRYTTIESPRGTVLEEGFTPLNFTGYQDIQYTVIIRDHGDSTFAHWENDETTRVRTLSLSNDTTITAFYRTLDDNAVDDSDDTDDGSPQTPTEPEEPEEPPEIFELIVNAADLSGNALTAHATIESSEDGEVMQEGDTPLNYTSTAGNSYQVTVQDIGDVVFEHWDDNSTNRTRTLVLDSDMPITAYYRDETEAIDSDEEEEEDDNSGGGSSSSGGGGGGSSSSGGGGGGSSSSGGGGGGSSSSGGGGGGSSSSGGGGGTTITAPAETRPPSYFASRPLAKILLQSAIFNNEDAVSSQVEMGEQITISTAFRNWQQVVQDYAVIIQIENSQGITRDIDWTTGNLEAGETASASKSWIPEEEDAYTVKIFVWDSVDQAPTPLTDVTSKRLIVE